MSAPFFISFGGECFDYNPGSRKEQALSRNETIIENIAHGVFLCGSYTGKAEVGREQKMIGLSLVSARAGRRLLVFFTYEKPLKLVS